MSHLTELLGIKHPIIQAPMANISTAPLVSAVSNQHCLGSLGAGYCSVAELTKSIQEINSSTKNAYSVNLFVLDECQVDLSSIEIFTQLLLPYYKILGVTPPNIPLIHSFDLTEHLQVIIEHHVPVVSFTFGAPTIKQIQWLHAHHIKCLGTATTLAECQLLESIGMDAIVVQGQEAGGHQATFMTNKAEKLTNLATLIPQAIACCKIPIIAAGGIMNTSGINAALSLGASAVQLGTAFLCAQEANTTPVYRAMIQSSAETTISSAFSGRNARAIINRFTLEMEQHASLFLPYPLQDQLTRPLRQAAQKQHLADFISAYAGQNHSMAIAGSAAEIIAKLLDSSFNSTHQQKTS